MIRKFTCRYSRVDKLQVEWDADYGEYPAFTVLQEFEHETTESMDVYLDRDSVYRLRDLLSQVIQDMDERERRSRE